MLTDRVNVRWPIPLFGAAALSVYAGFAAAWIVPLSWWGVVRLLGYGMLPDFVIAYTPLAVYFGIGPVVAGVVVANRVRRGALAGTYCLAAGFGILIALPIQFEDAVLPSARSMLLNYRLWIFVGSGIALAYVAAGVRRAIVCSIVEQDGRLCWKCAYPAGESSSEICPECGRAVTRAKRRGPVVLLSMWLDRHRRLAVLGLVVLWVGTFALAYHEHRPRAMFIQTFDAASYPAYAPDGIAAYLPESIEFTDGGYLVASLYSERAFCAPRIRLYRAYPKGGYVMVSLSTPHLYELDEQETRLALRYGLSDKVWDDLWQLKSEGAFGLPLFLLPRPSSRSSG